MKTQERMPHVATHRRTITVEGSAAALRTDMVVRTARGAAILALVLGSLGAAAESLGHGSAGHASAHHHATGHIRLPKGTQLSGPWMY